MKLNYTNTEQEYVGEVAARWKKDCKWGCSGEQYVVKYTVISNN